MTRYCRDELHRAKEEYLKHPTTDSEAIAVANLIRVLLAEDMPYERVLTYLETL